MPLLPAASKVNRISMTGNQPSLDMPLLHAACVDLLLRLLRDAAFAAEVASFKSIHSMSSTMSTHSVYFENLEICNKLLVLHRFTVGTSCYRCTGTFEQVLECLKAISPKNMCQ